jgi:uncharacterized membrane protein YccC
VARARTRRLRAALGQRLRRELTTMAVQAGVRAALATAAPIVLAYALGAPALVVAGVGGWLTSMADVGGALGTRLRTMGAYLLLGPVAFAAGVVAAPFPAPAVAALAAAWAAGGGLLRAGGEAGATLGVLVAATFAAALGTPTLATAPSTAHAALGGAGLLALGGVWALVLALVAWPVLPYRAARLAAAECYRALAAFARGTGEATAAAVAGVGAPARHFTALAREAHPRVRAAIEAARATLVAARRGRAGGSHRADDAAVLLDGAESLFLTLLTAAEAAEVAAGHARARATGTAAEPLAADVRALADACVALGAVLDVVADAAPAGRGAPRPLDVTAAVDALERTVVPLVESTDPERLAGASDAASAAGAAGGRAQRRARGRAAAGRAALRHAAALVEHAAGEAERAAEAAALLAGDGGDGRDGWRARQVAGPDAADTAAPAPARTSRWREAAAWVRAVASGADRETVRHALRLAVAVGTAQLLGAALHAERGPWVTVTALIVLQPSAGPTVRRSAARVVGTVAGALVAAALAATLHDPRLIAGVVFVLAGLAVTARGVHYGVFTFFLTPVFVLLAQPAPGDWALAGVRVADTLLGGGVALAAGLLLWPTWEATSLPATVADAVEAARAHLALAVRTVTDDAPPAPAALAQARRRAGLAATAGEGALDRLLAEPGGRRRGAALLALLARTRRLNGAASALAAFGAAPHASGAARLLALGTEVDTMLGEIAASARAGRVPGAPPRSVARLLDERGDGGAARTAERRIPDVPAWGALVRATRHALAVRVAAARLFGRREKPGAPRAG